MVMTAMECTWLLSWVAILLNCIEGLVSVSVRDSKISRFVDDSDWKGKLVCWLGGETCLALNRLKVGGL